MLVWLGYKQVLSKNFKYNKSGKNFEQMHQTHQNSPWLIVIWNITYIFLVPFYKENIVRIIKPNILFINISLIINKLLSHI